MKINALFSNLDNLTSLQWQVSPFLRTTRDADHPSSHSAQIIPVRCFTCGKVVGDKWEAFITLLAAEELDANGKVVQVMSEQLVPCASLFVHSDSKR